MYLLPYKWTTQTASHKRSASDVPGGTMDVMSWRHACTASAFEGSGVAGVVDTCTKEVVVERMDVMIGTSSESLEVSDRLRLSVIREVCWYVSRAAIKPRAKTAFQPKAAQRKRATFLRHSRFVQRLKRTGKTSDRNRGDGRVCGCAAAGMWVRTVEENVNPLPTKDVQTCGWRLRTVRGNSDVTMRL